MWRLCCTRSQLHSEEDWRVYCLQHMENKGYTAMIHIVLAQVKKRTPDIRVLWMLTLSQAIKIYGYLGNTATFEQGKLMLNQGDSFNRQKRFQYPPI